MISFIVEVLENLLRTLLVKFIKKDVLQTACSTLKLIKIDISDKKVQKSVGDLDLGFSIKHTLKQIASQKHVTDREAFMFKEEEEECFDFNQSLFRKFTLSYKIRIRLLGQVYHLSFLICYPYSLLFHALMLATLLEQKLPLMALGKTRN